MKDEALVTEAGRRKSELFLYAFPSPFVPGAQVFVGYSTRMKSAAAAGALYMVHWTRKAKP